MNNDNNPVVLFSSIPLDDEPIVGYDAIPREAVEEMQSQPVTVVDVQFKKGGKVYYFDPGALTLEQGQEVIIDTARGPEYGYCAGGNHQVPRELVVPPLRSVIRAATDQDRETRAQYKAKEAEAFAQCQERIAAHKLDMKLVSAEYAFDGSKILFYFTADGRVDFRDLVKDLAGLFRTRIELRQIGVRDEAKMLGGLGICGRPFCCKQFLDDFQPVSIKMAKTQSLSLNPTKISGTCGRLMCCLKYEQDAYESLIKSSPKTESIVNTYDGVGTVTDINILKQTVKVRLESDPSKQVCYNNCEVCVLRNGKGKKTDAPIDMNIPPLPRPKAEKPQQEEEIALFDESKLSNYTAGDAAREAERSAQAQRRRAAAAETEKTESRNRSRNRNRSKSGKKPKAAEPQKNQESGDRIVTRPLNVKKQNTKAEAADTPKTEAAPKENKSRNRNRYYRNRKKGGENKQN